MTYHLVHAGPAGLLGSDRAVIRADERTAFTDAVALLAAAGEIRDEAAASADSARQAARAEGLAEADAAVRELLAGEIAGFADAIERHAEARRADVAEAAYAAVRAILGEIDDAALVTRMVERTLARLPSEAPVTFAVAPEMATALANRLAGHEHVTVVADETLGPTDCHARTAQGGVIASLSVQLDALARRWGVAA